MIIISNFIEKNVNKKLFIICYTVLSLILITVVVILHTSYNTYNYKGYKLKIFSVNESSLIMKDSKSNMLVMSLDNSGLTPFDKKYTINYLGETLQYKSVSESDESIFTFSDGSQIMESLFLSQFNNDKENKSNNLSDIKLSEKNLIIKLTNYYSDYKFTWIYISVTIISFLFLGLGLGLLFYARAFWDFQTMFIVKDGEPTDWAIFSNKAFGIFIIVFAYVEIFTLLS